MRLKEKIISLTGIVIWLSFIWLHSFGKMASFMKEYQSWYGLVNAVFVLICTIMFFMESKKVRYAREKEHEFYKHFRYQKIIMPLLFCFMALMIVFEIHLESFSFYSYESISIFGTQISKSFLFDIYAIIIFPCLIDMLFKEIVRKEFERESLLSGYLQIIGITLLGYVFFSPLNNIWLAVLMGVNIVTLICAVYKYFWLKDEQDKIIIFLSCYIVGWVILMAVLYCQSEGDFLQYRIPGEWNYYQENVRLLMEKASIFGTSQELLEITKIPFFLVHNSNYIHQLLVYGGWAAVIVVLFILAVFLYVLYKMLGVQKSCHNSFLIYSAAFWILAVRIIMGSLYSFAILPYPINLPFSRNSGLLMDTMAFAFLLCCCYEEYKIEEVKRSIITEAKMILKEAEFYEVFGGLEEEPYKEDVDNAHIGDLIYDYAEVRAGP